MTLKREGRVLRARLNRPEKRNALDAAGCRAIVEAVREAERDRGIGCVLLEAEGKAFCAGMDLDEAAAVAPDELAPVHEELFTLGFTATVPIAAAIQGPALGGGLGLVANAHAAVAAQGSSFGLTEIRVGLWPYLVWRAVAAALGERRTLELSLSGRIFGSREALQWGLVQHVVPASELEGRAMQVAAEIAAASRETTRAGLEFVRAARGLGWREAGTVARQARAAAFGSPDFREGLAAFREKRAPKWPSLADR